MLSIIPIAAGLVAITVALHAAGFALVLRFVIKSRAAPPTLVWPITKLLVRLAWLLILIHVAEITIWALFYLWAECLPNAESAFYFSGVTYTTVGYGDLVLPEYWRILAPIEALAGILMCGLSAGLFFAMLTKIYTWRSEAKR
jgi:hypothetical protein